MVELGIREGNEYVGQWHLDVILDKKQNSFDDFYACVEWLIKEKYSTSNKIGVMGGAIAIQRTCV